MGHPALGIGLSALLLFVETEGDGLEVSAEPVSEVEAVVHPKSAAGGLRRSLARFALDRSQRVLCRRVQTLQFEAREDVAFLRGVDEGEDYRLGLIGSDGLRSRELAAVAG